MSDGNAPRKARVGWIRAVISVALGAVLLGAAGGAIAIIFSTEPTAEREAQTRKTAAFVEVFDVQRGDFRPSVEVLGQVHPARDVVLTPRVSGQIITMEPSFVPGGLVEAGRPLIRLDPADAERAVTTRRSELLQVEAELAMEHGRQRVAQREYELLGEQIDEDSRSLVLREPQIAIIQAQLEGARAALELAELNLERTTVRAPFDAQVLDRTVNIGSQIAAGDALGRLVGIDEYWIIASVPLRDLRWIVFDEATGNSSNVRVRHSTAWQPGEFRQARVMRLIGEVEPSSRLARVLVTLPDPLARETDGPPVVLGTLHQLEIEAREIPDVVRLDRDYLRQNDTVWLMVDNQLEIRSVSVVFRDANYAYISEGIETGDQVVTTSLATVTEGLLLRTDDDALELTDPPREGTP